MSGSAAEPEVGAPARVAVVVVCYALYYSVYIAINRYTDARATHVLFLPGEERLPLVPAFAIPYTAGVLLPLLMTWKLRERASFLRAMLAFGLSAFAAFGTFLLYPVTLERRPSESVLMRFVYVDGPHNAFPSMHVAIAWLVYLSCRDRVSRPRLLFATAQAVAVSTVLVKQHFIVDVIGGLALATVAWAVAGVALRGRAPAQKA